LQLLAKNFAMLLDILVLADGYATTAPLSSRWRRNKTREY
jgi:hypothetical protein